VFPPLHIFLYVENTRIAAKAEIESYAFVCGAGLSEFKSFEFKSDTILQTDCHVTNTTTVVAVLS